MTRVLVLGLTDTVGGIETFIKNLVLTTDKNEVIFDFVVKGKNEAVFSKEINSFYGGEQHISHITKMKINPIKCVRDMNNLYRKTKYETVYINTTTASDIMYASRLMGRCSSTRIVMHSHFAPDYKTFSNALFQKRCAQCADVKLACSVKAAEWLYGTSDNVIIINNGINTKKYQFSAYNRNEIRKRYGIGSKDLVIGHVGRLASPKNQLFLIETLKVMLDRKKRERDSNRMTKYDNIRLFLVGGGPDEEVLLHRIEKLGLDNNVIMPGVVDNTYMFYSAFDVFAMPSYHEGLPVVGIEAQCSGLPCFFSDTIDEQIIISDKSRLVHLGDNNQSEWANIIWDNCKCDNNTKREQYAEIISRNGYEISDVANKVIEILK